MGYFLSFVFILMICVTGLSATEAVEWGFGNEDQNRTENEAGIEAFRETPVGLAVMLFKEKQYAEAYEKFYELFLQHPADTWINFYLGLSALGAQEYDSAVAAFERVLIAEPGHVRARLELARALYSLRMYKQAEEAFKKVLETEGIPEEAAANIHRFLDAIEKTKIRNRFASAVMVGIQYDTNVNNGIGQNSYVIDSDILEGGVRGEKPVGDTIHQEMATLSHIYDFGSPGDYFMQNGFVLYGQNYLEESRNNILLYSLSTGIGNRRKNFTLSTRLHYDSIQIDKQTVLNLVGVEIGCSKPLGNTLLGELYLRTQQKTFPLDRDKDASFREAVLGMKKNMTGTKDLVSASLVYSTERARDSAIIDRDITGIRGGYTWYYNDRHSFSITVGYRSFAYPKALLDQRLELSKRRDKQSNLTVGNTYKLSKNSAVNGSFSYLDNQSTHSAYQYDKMAAGVNVMVRF